MARASARISTFGKSIKGWSDSSQITNPQEFHPQCRPEEIFDPKSGSCIPFTNIEGAEPVGTLECPEGYVLDETLGLCTPEGPTSQASLESDFTGRLSDVPKELRPNKPKKKINKASDEDSKTGKKKKKKKVYARDLLRQIREAQTSQ